MSTRASTAAAWLVDTVLVVAFVLSGRMSHNEGIGGTIATILPFFVGLQVGWMLRTGRPAMSIRWAGLIIWASTVVLGMILRAATGQGVALSFVIVTTLVLAAFLLGWRAILEVVRKRRGGSTPTD